MTDIEDPQVRLRPVTEDEFVAFRARAVPEYAAELARSRRMPEEKALASSEQTLPSSLAELRAQPHQTLDRVTSLGEDVGWLWLAPDEHSPDTLFVYDVEIDEPYRGRGLGRAAMLAAEEVARQAGFTTIALNVFGWNTRAESLYRSLGYQVQSTQLAKPLGEPS